MRRVIMLRAAVVAAMVCAALAASTAIAAPPAGDAEPPTPVASDAPKGDEPEADADSGDDGPHLKKKITVELSGYLDDAATEVVSPSARFEIQNPLAQWKVGGSFMVDVVTSASADIVATASPKWTDVRYAPAIDALFSLGDANLSLGANLSVESDFIAAGASAGVSLDLANKTVTPSLSYAFGYNLGGRRGTSFDVYQRVMHSHTLQAAVAIVANKSTLLVPTFTASLEFGDSAKPYRWVPTFEPGTALVPGESVESVTQKRTTFEVEERVPEERQRYAVSTLLAHRFTTVTLRLDERLYADSWGLLASTTDFMLPIDAGSAFRFWPHARVHAQSGVSFWQLGYAARATPAGVAVTGLRTGDRELGPLVGLTMGAGCHFTADWLGVGVTADALYTRFLDHLYVTDRWAGFGAVELEADF